MSWRGGGSSGTAVAPLAGCGRLHDFLLGRLVAVKVPGHSPFTQHVNAIRQGQQFRQFARRHNHRESLPAQLIDQVG